MTGPTQEPPESTHSRSGVPVLVALRSPVSGARGGLGDQHVHFLCSPSEGDSLGGPYASTPRGVGRSPSATNTSGCVWISLPWPRWREPLGFAFAVRSSNTPVFENMPLLCPSAVFTSSLPQLVQVVPFVQIFSEFQQQYNGFRGRKCVTSAFPL